MAGADAYDLSALVDVPPMDGVAPGSNILVAGPAMTGKTDLVMQALAGGLSAGEGAVALTTNAAAGDLLSDLERRDDPGWERVAAIDCRAEGGREEMATDEGATVHHVSSPSDFTELGVGILGSFDGLTDAGVNRARFGLTSLSTLLSYANRESVFKFCHVISSHLDTVGFVGLFTLDTSAHDEQTIEMLTRAFDGKIEVRETDGRREARVMGLQPDPSTWVAL